MVPAGWQATTEDMPIDLIINLAPVEEPVAVEEPVEDERAPEFWHDMCHNFGTKYVTNKSD